MFSTLGTLIKILLIAGLILALSRLPGHVNASWMDYDVQIQVGFLCAFGLLLLMLLLALHRVFLEILTFPKFWRWYQSDRRMRKGSRLLGQALSALAAEQPKQALRLASQADGLTPKAYDSGLAQLIVAQAARQSGDVPRMQKAYEVLRGREETSLLGYRGLVMASLADNRPFEALQMVREARARFPRQNWPCLMMYQLAITNEDWMLALHTLRELDRRRLMSRGDLKSVRAALHMQLADLAKGRQNRAAMHEHIKQAWKINPTFAPIAMAYAESQIDLGHEGRARKVIEKAWAVKPHPQMVQVWDQLVPDRLAKKPMHLVTWRKTLAKARPDDAESWLMIAEAALSDGLWGEAKTALQHAETLTGTQRLHKIWARYEDLAQRDETAVKRRLLMTNQADMDPVWFCSKTGRIYPAWSPLALPQRLFNTIQWGRPETRLTQMLRQSDDIQSADVLRIADV